MGRLVDHAPRPDYSIGGGPSRGMRKARWADMIRDEARAEAERWIASLNVLPCTYGTLIDLREPAAAVPYCGYYRMLILRAAERQLTKQGARVVLPD
jgi:hypothetical protein